MAYVECDHDKYFAHAEAFLLGDRDSRILDPQQFFFLQHSHSLLSVLCTLPMTLLNSYYSAQPSLRASEALAGFEVNR